MSMAVENSRARCAHDVPHTVEALKALLAALNIPVFAVFDHGANAQAVGLSLRPTQVIVFGAPAVGTKLMEEEQAIALELPLRIVVWEDAEGGAWIACPKMTTKAAAYGLKGHPVAAKMDELLGNLVAKVSA